jgi:hypothetical protein
MELENFKNYISEVKGDLENWHRDPEDMGLFNENVLYQKLINISDTAERLLPEEKPHISNLDIKQKAMELYMSVHKNSKDQTLAALDEILNLVKYKISESYKNEYDKLYKTHEFDRKMKDTNLTERERQNVQNAIQSAADSWITNKNLPLETRKQISENYLTFADSTITAAIGRKNKPKHNIVIQFFFSLFHRL